MASPTVAEFRAQFPATFADTADATIAARIGEARRIHDVRKLATIYLAAHLLTLDAEATGAHDAGAGVVKSEKIGPRQVDYLTMARDGHALRVFCETSSYGRRFLALAVTSARASIGARVVA